MIRYTDTISKSDAIRAIQIAATNCYKAQMLSSAELCLEDARKCYERGDWEGAYRRAADSLRYSIGC